MGKKTIAHNTPNANTKETRNRNLGVNRNKGEQLPTSYNNGGCSNPPSLLVSLTCVASFTAVQKAGEKIKF